MSIKVLPGEKSKFGSQSKFDLKISISNSLDIVQTLTEKELKNLLKDISTILGYQEILEKFDCTFVDAEDITKFWGKERRCEICELKMKQCFKCVKVCESPLERDLFIKLIVEGFQPELQLRINKDNTQEKYPQPVNKELILTIPDFYIESENKKVCIYTDGHTYHERNEYQASRDRNIDRELQGMGYLVLRFTGKEVRDDINKVFESIKKNLD